MFPLIGSWPGFFRAARDLAQPCPHSLDRLAADRENPAGFTYVIDGHAKAEISGGLRSNGESRSTINRNLPASAHLLLIEVDLAAIAQGLAMIFSVTLAILLVLFTIFIYSLAMFYVRRDFMTKRITPEFYAFFMLDILLIVSLIDVHFDM